MTLLSLAQTLTAVGPSITSSFQGIGGSGIYSYAVLAGGAGGTIASNGVYTAPSVLSSNPKLSFDTVRVTDSMAATATATITVGNALLLFCDIIAQGLSLTSDRVRLWDQKLFQPTDSGLFVAVSVPICKIFGSLNNFNSTTLNQVQNINSMAIVDVDIISRGPDARDRKEEVVMAVYSQYSQQQQQANAFYIGQLPPSSQFINLSMVDGAAIPYRYKITFNMQYMTTKIQPAQYFDTFSTEQLSINDDSQE